ncbi:hypothetical protein JNM05_12885 [bacterium]|nr:hypothetical protein [bacterium]
MNSIRLKFYFDLTTATRSFVTSRVILRKFVIFALMVCMTGCAYSFSGANLGGIKTVAVPVFDNITSEPGIRERVTNELVRAILDDNNFKIADLKLADAVIAGKITKIDDVPFSFEGSGNTFSTTDYKITITTTIRFENKKEKKTLWEESITGWGRYTLQGDKRRNDGIDEAVKMITQNVLNKVVSDW